MLLRDELSIGQWVVSIYTVHHFFALGFIPLSFFSIVIIVTVIIIVIVIFYFNY